MTVACPINVVWSCEYSETWITGSMESTGHATVRAEPDVRYTRRDQRERARKNLSRNKHDGHDTLDVPRRQEDKLSIFFAE